jgi:hypothetical protein
VAWGGVGALVIGGACIAIFWKGISEWWNGPVEESAETIEKNEEDDE